MNEGQVTNANKLFYKNKLSFINTGNNNINHNKLIEPKSQIKIINIIN